MAASASDVIIAHQDLYAVDTLWAAQARHHISNLTCRLQDKGAMGKTTRIRLIALQKKRWTCRSVLEWPTEENSKHGENIIARILNTMKETGIYFSKNLDHTIEGNPIERGITIEEGINNWAVYKEIRSKLQKHELMFIGQLAAHGGKSLLTWREISKLIKGTTKPGRSPTWFKMIEDKFIQPGEEKTRIMHMHLQTNEPNIWRQVINNTFTSRYKEG